MQENKNAWKRKDMRIKYCKYKKMHENKNA